MLVAASVLDEDMDKHDIKPELFQGFESREANVLEDLTEALFYSKRVDELEPLIPRFREVAKERSRKMGRLSIMELHSLSVSARFHEVLCTLTQHGKALQTARPLRSTKVNSICHRIHCASKDTTPPSAFLLLQARGELQEAKREWRSLLAAKRADKAEVQVQGLLESKGTHRP